MFELPKQALVVTAHPDDIDFGGGGTVAWLRSQGVGVSYCICTDGNQGGEDPSVSRDEMRKIRRSEQIAAGAILGVTDVSFLSLHRSATNYFLMIVKLTLAFLTKLAYNNY